MQDRVITKEPARLPLTDEEIKEKSSSASMVAAAVGIAAVVVGSALDKPEGLLAEDRDSGVRTNESTMESMQNIIDNQHRLEDLGVTWLPGLEPELVEELATAQEALVAQNELANEQTLEVDGYTLPVILGVSTLVGVFSYSAGKLTEKILHIKNERLAEQSSLV